MKKLQGPQDIVRRLTPEEQELERKRAELFSLESKLGERELELATLRGELAAFEAKYLRIVGQKYAELDELEAKIAEAIARSQPANEAAQEKAREERKRANESAQAAGVESEDRANETFKPSESLKKLYRDVAKAVHPDLAENEDDRKRREKLMAEANKAYKEGDEDRLRAILRNQESDPDAVKGDGTGAELVRIIRKIARVGDRLIVIGAEIERAREGDLSLLKSKCDEASAQGRNLLEEMAAALHFKIGNAKRRLANCTLGQGD